MNASHPLILVVASDSHVCEPAVDVLVRAGFKAIGVDDAKAALTTLTDGSHVRAVFIDTDNGFELAKKIREAWPHIDIVLTSSPRQPEAGTLLRLVREFVRP